MIGVTLILLLGCMASFTSAMPTAVSVIQDANATTFLGAAQTIGDKKILGGDANGPYTILVPVNSAFEKLSAPELQALTTDVSLLTEVLGVHVIDGELFSWDFVNGRVLGSTNGHLLRVYVSASGSTYINDAKVLKWDLEAQGAVIILIDTVLDAPEGSIYDILRSADYGLGTLADLVDSAHLNNTLHRGVGPYTIFAPSQAAFDRLSPVIVQELKTNPTLLRHTLEYHIHQGTVHLKSLDRNGTLTTLYRGHNIGIIATQTDIRLNTVAALEEVDIDADNGVVHIIDHVLIPSTLGSIIG